MALIFLFFKKFLNLMFVGPHHSDPCIIYQVYIIDFGLAKRYRDSTTNRHIPYRYPSGLNYVSLTWFPILTCFLVVGILFSPEFASVLFYLDFYFTRTKVGVSFCLGPFSPVWFIIWINLTHQKVWECVWERETGGGVEKWISILFCTTWCLI